MPQYKPYPTVQTTPNRKQRKSARRSTFEFNRAQSRVEKYARQEARKGK